MVADLNEQVRQPSRAQHGRGGSAAWILQVVSGVLLVVLLGVHIVAPHFVVKGGLRAVLLDFGFGRRGQALITYSVAVLGAVTAAHSFWLIATTAAKS